jgi:MYXO-CTERM domain-containing protein
VVRAGATALVVGILATGLPSSANAYVRYTASNGMTFKWGPSCIFITSYASNFLDMMPPEEVTAATQGAAAVWSTPQQTCTYLDIRVTASDATAPRAVNDHRNVLIFRNVTWCDLLKDGTCAADLGPYEPAALAVTSVIANRDTGEIRDADIEFNSLHHRWADLELHPELLAGDPGLQDLQNALTHEMGHLIGLDHTCFAASLTAHPKTNTGEPAPDCNDVGPDVIATTMFPSANPGDLGKRTLEDDDRQALCDIYPVASDPKACAPPSDDTGCNCSVVAPAGSGIATLGLLTFAGFRRRRSRRT